MTVINTLIVLAISAWKIGDVRAVQWQSGFQDGVVVDACAGQISVSFPWAVTMEPGEELVDIQWFYRNLSQELVATYTHGNFFVTPTFSRRVQRVPDVGLTLQHVTRGDAGNYSVEVIVMETGGSLTTLFRAATLNVYSEAGAEADAAVHVSESLTAVPDAGSGRYSLKLSCTSTGRRPEAVIWTGPSGPAQIVAPDHQGEFNLLLTPPFKGGNYSCRIHPDLPVARCLPNDSLALQGDSVHVDEMEARLVLLEARQEDVVKKNQVLETENAQLKNAVDSLRDARAPHVSFHAQLSGNVTVDPDFPFDNGTGTALNFTRVIHNQAEAYNASTGTFTAPYNGSYAFLVATVPLSNIAQADPYIQVDGVTVNHCRPANQGGVVACNLVTWLGAGQRVRVYASPDQSFSPQGTSFSGFLLN